ncbi:MAG: hypothetical protein O7D86_10010 [Proteobacteria bacterium]|nr:hypothetical protein [Pseudomonadota bacterium]
MYTTCPKCKYVRQTTDDSNPDICPACGIIFSKWMKQQFSSPTTQKIINNKPESNISELIKESTPEGGGFEITPERG